MLFRLGWKDAVLEVCEIHRGTIIRLFGQDQGFPRRFEGLGRVSRFKDFWLIIFSFIFCYRPQQWPQRKLPRARPSPKVRYLDSMDLRGWGRTYCHFDFVVEATGSKENKAKAAKKAALQGAHSHASRKTRFSVSFHRPKTLKLAREPRYPRKSIPHAPRMDQFRTIVSCVVLGFNCCAMTGANSLIFCSSAP